MAARTGVASSGWGQGVGVGDFDNDGLDDSFVICPDFFLRIR